MGDARLEVIPEAMPLVILAVVVGYDAGGSSRASHGSALDKLLAHAP
jgi:hypothetical protein